MVVVGELPAPGVGCDRHLSINSVKLLNEGATRIAWCNSLSRRRRLQDEAATCDLRSLSDTNTLVSNIQLLTALVSIQWILFWYPPNAGRVTYCTPYVRPSVCPVWRLQRVQSRWKKFKGHKIWRTWRKAENAYFTLVKINWPRSKVHHQFYDSKSQRGKTYLAGSR